MKNEIKEQLHEQTIILEPQECYNNAIVEVQDYKLVYDYDLIIDCLMSFYKWEYIDALEWIEYNTIRSLPYMGKYAPIIVQKDN
tara:strand:- start:29277 stop:29528 length:252 start_codon:yes stop_codon:yes gene_type:complete